MGSGDVGAILFSVCIGLLERKGTRLDRIFRHGSLRPGAGLRPALCAELGAIRQPRAAMGADWIRRRLQLEHRRSNIGYLETRAAHGAELGIGRNIITAMRAHAGGRTPR